MHIEKNKVCSYIQFDTELSELQGYRLGYPNIVVELKLTKYATQKAYLEGLNSMVWLWSDYKGYRSKQQLEQFIDGEWLENFGEFHLIRFIIDNYDTIMTHLKQLVDQGD